MPTNTFYNLPEDKRNKVIEAAIDEFIRAENGEIIVKNIINQAGIPRGSFYQYFETKEDLVDYIMESHMLQNEEDFSKKIEEVDGDILVAFEKFFYNTITRKNEKRMILQKKIMEHIKRTQERENHGKCVHPPRHLNMERVLKSLDKSKYRIDTDEELATVFHMIMGVMIKNIVDFQNGNSEQEAIKYFKRDLDYLRYGIIKK